MQSDLLDELVSEWKAERPELNARAMLVVGRLLRLGQMLESNVSIVLKPFGLHYTDLDILATLRRKGRPFQLTPTELSSAVILTSGAMTAALRRLENGGLIARRDDSKDRRIRYVALTPSGKRLIDKAIEVRFQEATDSLNGLTAPERKQLGGLLKKLLLSHEKDNT